MDRDLVARRLGRVREPLKSLKTLQGWANEFTIASAKGMTKAQLKNRCAAMRCAPDEIELRKLPKDGSFSIAAFAAACARIVCTAAVASSSPCSLSRCVSAHREG